MPRGRMTWCFEDAVWFIELLTLPEGGPVKLEGYARLILRTAMRTGMVELLVLLPKGNGKTTILAGLAVFHLLTVRNAQCFIGAADVEQAGELFRFAQHFCESEPEIARAVKITESTRTIKAASGGGRLKILASDSSKSGGKRHSYSPTLAILDEGHAHANDNLYVALRSAAFKRHGLVVNISTAGHNVNTMLGQLRAEFLRADQKGGTVRHGLVVNGEGSPGQGDGRLCIAETANGANVMLQWACLDGSEGWGPPDDLSDMPTVKLANPASFVTVAGLQDALEAPGITPWDFARYRANVWTLGFKSWLPTTSWDPMAAPELAQGIVHRTWERASREELRAQIARMFPAGAELYGAVDMARYRDCAAIGLVCPRATGPIIRALVWQSGGQDEPIRYDPIMDAIRDLDDAYLLEAMGWDPKYFDQPAETLTGEGIRMVQFPQSPERMCPAAGDARTEIVNGEWQHDGDPVLRAHMLAGAAIDKGPNQFMVGKAENNGPPIDACVAVLMARALSRTPRPKVSAAFW